MTNKILESGVFDPKFLVNCIEKALVYKTPKKVADFVKIISKENINCSIKNPEFNDNKNKK